MGETKHGGWLLLSIFCKSNRGLTGGVLVVAMSRPYLCIRLPEMALSHVAALLLSIQATAAGYTDLLQLHVLRCCGSAVRVALPAWYWGSSGSDTGKSKDSTAGAATGLYMRFQLPDFSSSRI